MLKIDTDLRNVKISADDLIKVSGKLHVGFFENAKYSDGKYVAQVARDNEYGTHRIPMRPFFRQAIHKNKNKWLGALGNLISKDNTKALDIVGEVARTDIIQSIINLKTPPNAQQTIERKGSSNPLVDTGLMYKSVTYKISK